MKPCPFSSYVISFLMDHSEIIRKTQNDKVHVLYFPRREQDLLTKTEQRQAHTCGLVFRTKKVKSEKGIHRQQTQQTQGLMGRAVYKGRGPISKSAKAKVKTLSHRKTWSLAYKDKFPDQCAPKMRVPLD